MRGRLSIALMALIATLAASPAVAQVAKAPLRTTIFGGYGWLREAGLEGGPAVTYNKGWAVSVARLTTANRLAFVGEVGGQYRHASSIESISLYGFLGGFRFVLTRGSRLTTFAQALVGAETFSSPGFTEAGFAFQPGGGLDIALHRRVAIRVQGDFRMGFEEGVMFKEARFTTGIVVGLGR